MIMRGSDIEVVGKSAVVVIDPRHATIPAASDGAVEAGTGLVFHVPSLWNVDEPREIIERRDAVRGGHRTARHSISARASRRIRSGGARASSAARVAGRFQSGSNPRRGCAPAGVPGLVCAKRKCGRWRPQPDAAHIVLTVRADTLERHGGQVSLPGGVVDPGETFEQAALREAHEEIALAPDNVMPLGALTPLDIPVSGFRLHPIVAATGHRPALRAADGEVAAILEIAVDELVAPSNFIEHARNRDGVSMIVPGFHVRSMEDLGRHGHGPRRISDAVGLEGSQSLTK